MDLSEKLIQTATVIGENLSKFLVTDQNELNINISSTLGHKHATVGISLIKDGKDIHFHLNKSIPVGLTSQQEVTLMRENAEGYRALSSITETCIKLIREEGFNPLAD